MLPPAAAFDDVKVGQHYVYQIDRDTRLDEEIVAIDRAGLTVRLVTRAGPRAAARTVERTIPRDVVWFVKTYRPEFLLANYGTSGYDAAYFRAMMASHPYQNDPVPQDVKGPRALTISGRRFLGVRSEGTWLARTRNGCVEARWQKTRTTRYPFTLEYVINDVPAVVLREIR